MSWARKNEKARIYKDGKDFVLVLLDVDDVPTIYRPKDPERFSVTVSGSWARIYCDGFVQTDMHLPSTTLCLASGSVRGRDATPEQILEAYLGDESIYASDEDRKDDYIFVRGQTPATYGGSAKRLALADVPADVTDRFTQVLRAYGIAPEEARGLHRL